MREATVRRWHRRVGAVLAVFLATQALSGGWMSARALLGFVGVPDAVSLQLIHAHHGGGIPGGVYRVLVGAATLWMAGSGLAMYRWFRARRQPGEPTQ